MKYSCQISSSAEQNGHLHENTRNPFHLSLISGSHRQEGDAPPLNETFNRVSQNEGIGCHRLSQENVEEFSIAYKVVLCLSEPKAWFALSAIHEIGSANLTMGKSGMGNALRSSPSHTTGHTGPYVQYVAHLPIPPAENFSSPCIGRGIQDSLS